MPVPRGVAIRIARETGRDVTSFPGHANTKTNSQVGQDAWGIGAGPDAWSKGSQEGWSNGGQDSWGKGTWSQNAWAQNAQEQSWSAPAPTAPSAQSQEIQNQEALAQQAQMMALAQAHLQAQAQAQEAQLELACAPTAASTEPAPMPQIPDLSGIQLQPSSWTHAVFDQTARELWQRLNEEGHPQEECIELFQSHMVAVYTQMQTQQQYEAIAEVNANVTQVMDHFTPKDPMSKLKPLCKGDEKEPHRTCLGVDPLMKYHEHQKNAPHGIFIGGLRTVTNEDTLVKYFIKFGEVSFVEVKRLPDRTSRGFAFLHYASEAPIGLVLQDKDNHMIDGKMITCRKREALEMTKQPGKKLKDTPDRLMAEQASMMSAFQQSMNQYGGGYGGGYQPY